ncbi:MAG: IclR family transcriptional regulator [Burkholderiaceae bacterium]
MESSSQAEPAELRRGSENAPQRVEAVERALSLLTCFERRGQRLALTDLAARTGLYKSTVLRLASSLERLGYLRRDAGRRFVLGPELVRLGHLASPAPDFETRIRALLRQLVEFTGETASFYVRDGDARVCRYRENSPRSARHHLEEGARLPLTTGAAGHVLTAFSGGEADQAGQAVRVRGWSSSEGERDPDVAAVAVPVFDAAGRLSGALTVSGLRSRFDARQRGSALNELLRAAEALRRDGGSADGSI